MVELGFKPKSDQFKSLDISTNPQRIKPVSSTFCPDVGIFLLCKILVEGIPLLEARPNWVYKNQAPSSGHCGYLGCHQLETGWIRYKVQKIKKEESSIGPCWKVKSRKQTNNLDQRFLVIWKCFMRWKKWKSLHFHLSLHSTRCVFLVQMRKLGLRGSGHLPKITYLISEFAHLLYYILFLFIHNIFTICEYICYQVIRLC